MSWPCSSMGWVPEFHSGSDRAIIKWLTPTACMEGPCLYLFWPSCGQKLFCQAVGDLALLCLTQHLTSVFFLFHWIPSKFWMKTSLPMCNWALDFRKPGWGGRGVLWFRCAWGQGLWINEVNCAWHPGWLTPSPLSLAANESWSSHFSSDSYRTGSCRALS